MRKTTRKALVAVSLGALFISGCATMPSGPSVMVLPTPGKPFEVFMQEDAECRMWAEQRLGISPQEQHDQSVAQGAVVGTVLGAGVGAMLGAASGNAGAGAAIGAGSGLLLGSVSGADSGQAYGYQAQRRYDNSYLQCMYAKGNQVPGTVRREYRQRRVATPPPPPPAYDSVPPDYVEPGY
ncbi:hypothetical protein GMLC_17080 [Geomonas limicola]|uniref:Glycine-zipper-containing OmpA-like membrane domain-containing protein n=1 Tax=Geomonas limicola TaxID=2740186 RepID=A0A6V8NA51_9BACT|nr:glycine zipper family protein [Geomonas limicola]GFO68129.1 hypothetical protein GMLC_17080 [Geomonas limicola]